MDNSNKFKDRNPQTLMSARLSLLIIFFVFSVVVFLSLVFGGALFGTAGKAINSFILGSFGHSAYPLFISAIFIAVKFMRGNRVSAGRRNISCFVIMFIAAVLCYHQLTSAQIFYNSQNISEYLLSCFNAAAEGQVTGGGVVFGIVLYPITTLFGVTGSYILLCLTFGITLAVLIYSRRFNSYGGYKVSGVKEYPSDYFSQGGSFQAPPQVRQPISHAQQGNYVLPDFPDPQRVLGMEKQPSNLKLDEQEAVRPEVETVSKKLFVGFIDDYVNPRKRSAKQERSYDILYSSKNAKAPSAVQGEEPYTASGGTGLPQGAQKLGGSSYVDTFGDDMESKKKYILTPIDLLRPETDYGYGGNSPIYPLKLNEESEADRAAKPKLINHGSLGGLPKAPDRAPAYKDKDIGRKSGRGAGSTDLPYPPNLSQYQKYANENAEGTFPASPPPRPAPSQSHTDNKLNSLMEKYSGLANEKSGLNQAAGNPPRPVSANSGGDIADFDGYLSGGTLPEFKYPPNSDRESDQDRQVDSDIRGNAPAEMDSQRPASGKGADIMRFDDAARSFPGNADYADKNINSGNFPAGALGGQDGFGRQGLPSRGSGFDGQNFSGAPYTDSANDGGVYRGNTTDAGEGMGRPQKPQEIKVQTQLSVQKDKKPVVTSPYVAPLTSLLKDIVFDPNEVAENYEEKVAVLEQALEDFKVPAKVVTVTPGPAVTRYELQMPPGVPVSRLTSRANDIAMYLASSGEIRIEAPIPGKSLLGIELPNKKRAKVGLKEVIDSQEFLSNKSPVAFALGKDIAGKNVIVDFTKMPHLLVAGSTGSGKSVCLNTLIISLLYKSSPEDVRLILIDPKRVEFNVYNGLPHLMLKDVITDTEKALSAFNWAINEMDRRFELFKDTGAKDIISYNEKIKKTDAVKLPRIMIIVDELAELMMVNKRELEERIKKISQLSRAAGIHLILATQRPSVDIITGVIKANLSSRVTFKLMTQADSRTILDSSGAEKLLGEGDMIFITSSMPKPVRLQGPFVSMTEVESIVEFIKENNDSYFDDEVAEKILNPIEELPDNEEEDSAETEQDKYFLDALRLAVDSGQISISMVQRKFSVGYSRAGKIIDEMERHNYITPFEGSKPRQVLISRDEFERRFGDRE